MPEWNSWWAIPCFAAPRDGTRPYLGNARAYARREEDAADTFAALQLLQIGTDFSRRSLADAAKGWFLDGRRDQDTGEKPPFYDEHNLSQQRAYQIVCLMVGSDPVKFKGLADETKMPEARQKTCKRDYTKATAAWDLVLEPYRRGPRQQGGAQIKVVYGDGKGRFDGLAQLFRSIQFLETVARRSEADYVWPTPFTLEMQTCGHPGAVWDDETRTITMCYKSAFISLNSIAPTSSRDPRRPHKRENRGQSVNFSRGQSWACRGAVTWDARG